MSQSILKECLEAVACSRCGSRLILTKEKILFCQPCCIGYPMQGEIPNLRQSQAIDFRKLTGIQKKGVVTELTVQKHKGSRERFEVPRGHCVLVGRAVRQDPNTDITYVGQDETPIQINYHTQQLIERILSQSNYSKKESPKAFTSMPFQALDYIGGYKREADVFIDDRSVSRAHAIFFQDDDGLWVLDLVSKNGTYVNGREVEKAKLKNKDVVSIGVVGIKVKIK